MRTSLLLAILGLFFVLPVNGQTKNSKPRNIKRLGKVEFDQKFDGIFETNEKYTQILLIHGIGVQPKDYAQNFIASCKGYLNLTDRKLTFQEEFSDLVYHVPKELYKPSIPGLTNPGIYREEYKRILGTDTSTVVFYIVHWSPITTPLKSWLNAVDEEKRRSKLLRTGKTKLFNQGLSDVAEYFNPVIRERIITLISYAFALASVDYFEKFPGRVEIPTLNIVSASFGSKTAFDAIKKAEQSFIKENSTFLNLFSESQGFTISEKLDDSLFLNSLKIKSRNYNFYMLSNQLPLLEISDFDAINTYEEGSPEFIAQKDLEEDFKSTLIKNFVIFHDPNDFLGYYVPEELLRFSFSGEIENICNSTYRNARRVRRLSNPIKAHTNSFQNCEMHYYILYGYDKDPNVDKKNIELKAPEPEKPNKMCNCFTNK